MSTFLEKLEEAGQDYCKNVGNHTWREVKGAINCLRKVEARQWRMLCEVMNHMEHQNISMSDVELSAWDFFSVIETEAAAEEAKV